MIFDLQKPILFVAHSLGGLVVKKVFNRHMALIIKALNIAVIDDDYKLIYKASKGIVFIGTPHRGSSLPSYLSNILALAFSGKKYVSELAQSNTAITEITRDFIKHAVDMHFVSFYESKGMPIIGVFFSQ